MITIPNKKYIYSNIINNDGFKKVHAEKCDCLSSEDNCQLGCFDHSYRAVERANRRLLGKFTGCEKCCSHLTDEFKETIKQSNKLMWFAVDSTAIKDISWKNNTLYYHYKNRPKRYSYPYYSYQREFLFDDFLRLLEYKSKGRYINNLVNREIKLN